MVLPIVKGFTCSLFTSHPFVLFTSSGLKLGSTFITLGAAVERSTLELAEWLKLAGVPPYDICAVANRVDEAITSTGANRAFANRGVLPFIVVLVV